MANVKAHLTNIENTILPGLIFKVKWGNRALLEFWKSLNEWRKPFVCFINVPRFWFTRSLVARCVETFGSIKLSMPPHRYIKVWHTYDGTCTTVKTHFFQKGRKSFFSVIFNCTYSFSNDGKVMKNLQSFLFSAVHFGSSPSANVRFSTSNSSENTYFAKI